MHEIAIAREGAIPDAQIIGRNDRECPSVPNAGRVYGWTWDNLEKLLH